MRRKRERVERKLAKGGKEGNYEDSSPAQETPPPEETSPPATQRKKRGRKPNAAKRTADEMEEPKVCLPLIPEILVTND